MYEKNLGMRMSDVPVCMLLCMTEFDGGRSDGEDADAAGAEC
jgi:hypothetical protein